MIFLWTTSNRVGSKLIRWGRGDDCSHFSVCWDQLVEDLPREHWLVTESRIRSGVKADWLSVVEKTSAIQHQIKFDISPSDERSLYGKFIKEMGGKQYDSDGVVFFALSSLAEKLGFPKASKNPWASRRNVFCTETIEVFRDYLNGLGAELPERTGLLEPHDLYELLK